MDNQKKNVLISGMIHLPLKIGERAVIFQNNGGSTHTSIVEAINQIAESFIMFETENSVYCVRQSKSPVSKQQIQSAA